MLTRVIAFALVAASAFASAMAAEGCPPSGYTSGQLQALKSNGFAVADDRQRNALAVALIPCLASVQPQLRDYIAFEALSTWMRGKQLTTATVSALYGELLPWLAPGRKDPEGVARPFAALVLSEVARVDRIDPFMCAEQRQQLLRAAISYISTLRDYRGFDAAVGWRHGVAHGSDLLMQIALNPQVAKPDLGVIIAAVATQVAPPGEHFYIYGEGERLARVVLVVAQRKEHSAQEWREWVGTLTSPAPLAQWSDAFASQSGLAKRHNTRAFLSAVYLGVQVSDNEDLRLRLMQPLVNGIEKID